MNKAKKIVILDTTLREGEQARGLCFSVAEKIAIAHKLRDFGVNLIEIGQPGISASEATACSAICRAVSGVEFLVHARACAADVLAAEATGAQWVGIWASYNDISLMAKFNNKSRAWVRAQVVEAISLAKDRGMKVRFTIEDASRTDAALIHELGMAAVAAGADRISLADTVGVWHPQECAANVAAAVRNFNCEIEVHLHNDLGLAQANALAAIDNGASVIDATVLGIGERAGICDLFTLSAALQYLYKAPKYNFALAKDLTQAVSRIAGFQCEPHRPIVGRDIFTHVAKYHVTAAEKNPAAYSGLNPQEFAATSSVALNHLERQEQQRVVNDLQVQTPLVKGASELLYHRDGVGKRWVFMDQRIDARSPIYLIERVFERDYSGEYQPHVDAHAHHCDSVFVFMGINQDGSGLTVEVSFGVDEQQTTKTITSPASVFIPANIVHSYAYVSGAGRFLNLVLAPNYNKSLVASEL